MHGTTVIERAFQLAADCSSLKELRAKLHKEGYGANITDAHLAGRLIKAQLASRMARKQQP